LARLPARQPQIIVNGGPGLIREFEPHWPSGLFLADGRAVKGVSARCYVLDPDCNDIAAAEFAVDREIEKCQIASAILHLKPGANGPNLAWP
jgi:hypothetical protein